MKHIFGDPLGEINKLIDNTFPDSKRMKELKKEYDLEEWSSSCCGASIWMPDTDGHGKCNSCKENTTPTTFEEWLEYK